MNRDSRICISGGGPAGLVSAMMLMDLGYTNITLIEQRVSPTAFEKNKAFTYHLNVRGQQILNHLDCMDAIREVAVPSMEWVIHNIDKKGNLSTLPPFFMESDASQTCWLMRNALLDVLDRKLDERNKGQVETHYCSRSRGVLRETDGSYALEVEDPEGTRSHLPAHLILACDGIASPVRESVCDLPEIDPEHFASVRHPSPAADLRYRVLELGPTVRVNGEPFTMDDPNASYRFVSKFKNPQMAMTIAAMPCRDIERPRPVNIILHKDHHLWTINSPSELRAYFADAFPQLDLAATVSDREFENFVKIESGAFPTPRYTKRVYAELKSDERDTHVILLGDSAHAFPPDLGLGVNSALEDVWEFRKSLLNNGFDLAAAGHAYEQQRLPDSAAVTRLVQRVFPYQYNQSPPRLMLSLAYMLLQNKMNWLVPSLFSRHGFSIAREGTRPFREIEATYNRTNAAYLVLLLSLIAIAAAVVIL